MKPDIGDLEIYKNIKIKEVKGVKENPSLYWSKEVDGIILSNLPKNAVNVSINGVKRKSCCICINRYACVIKSIKCPRLFYPSHEFSCSGKVKNRKELSSATGYFYSKISSFYKNLNEDDSQFYKKIVIKKKSGGKRILFAPEKSLKSLQKSILEKVLYPSITMGVHLHGGVPGRSTVTAADHHVGKKIVIKIDLQNFFPSIHAGRVSNSLLQHFKRDVSTLITRICTYDQHLAQGIPTSPFLANVVASRLDSALLDTVCEEHDLSYTRYIDDLTFSTDIDCSRDDVNKIIHKIFSIVGSSGFKINKEKVNVLRSHRRQRVLGVVVNEKLNSDKHTRKTMRAIINNCKKNGIKTQTREMDIDSFVRKIDGKLSYLSMLNKETCEKLKREWVAVKECDEST